MKLKLGLRSYIGLALVAFGVSVPSISAFAAVASETTENPLSGEAQFSTYKLEAHKPVELKIKVHLPEGYHAYGDKFKLEINDPEGFAFQNIQITPLHDFYDETSKKNRSGVTGNADILIPMEAPSHLQPGDYKMKLDLIYQACTNTYCLFPTKLHMEVPFQFVAATTDMPAASTVMPSLFKMDSANLLEHGLAVALLLSFIAGFLTSLTPCIFPIIPITMAVLGRTAHLNSKKKNFLLAVFYVLGIAAAYSTLGILAAATGSMFGSYMNHPVVLGTVCIVFFAMALGMFGAFELQAPAFIRNRFAGDLPLSGYPSALVYGIIAGVVAGPCVGPVLVGILTYVAKTQNLWLGFWLLFFFALGMGQLFIAIGMFSQFTKLLPKSGAWMESVKNFFGFLMLLAAFYYLNFLIPTRLWDACLGIALVVIGSLFGAFTPIAGLSTFKKLGKGFHQTLIFIGAAFITIGLFNLRPLLAQQGTSIAIHTQELQWQPYSAEALAQAKAQHKPVMVDFWAEWCTACKELEHFTFADPVFQAEASHFVLMKFDATNESDVLLALRAQYELIGLPTLLFFDQNGVLHKDLTTNEVVDAKVLAEKMQKLHN